MTIANEMRTVEAMIRLFCRQQHGTEDLCPDCQELRVYAGKRLPACRYGDDKPACKNCPIHCYAPRMRERITEVMRYAGPRMPLAHPLLALRHLLNRSRPGRAGEGRVDGA